MRCFPPPENKIVRVFNHLTETEMDSLLQLYGNNKTFVEEFLEPTLIALSYFPELKDVHLIFRYSSEATTMAARPVPITVLGNTKYQILINNQTDFQGVSLCDVPFNAQIGVIAHELSHIADYESHNFWGISGIMFRYLDCKRKPLFEKEIDKATIERGLGWQLYDWAVYSMYDNDKSSEDYKSFKRKTYMNPEEIEQWIQFYSNYSKSFFVK